MHCSFTRRREGRASSIRKVKYFAIGSDSSEKSQPIWSDILLGLARGLLAANELCAMNSTAAEVTPTSTPSGGALSEDDKFYISLVLPLCLTAALILALLACVAYQQVSSCLTRRRHKRAQTRRFGIVRSYSWSHGGGGGGQTRMDKIKLETFDPVDESVRPYQERRLLHHHQLVKSLLDRNCVCAAAAPVPDPAEELAAKSSQRSARGGGYKGLARGGLDGVGPPLARGSVASMDSDDFAMAARRKRGRNASTEKVNLSAGLVQVHVDPAPSIDSSVIADKIPILPAPPGFEDSSTRDENGNQVSQKQGYDNQGLASSGDGYASEMNDTASPSSSCTSTDDLNPPSRGEFSSAASSATYFHLGLERRGVAASLPWSVPRRRPPHHHHHYQAGGIGRPQSSHSASSLSPPPNSPNDSSNDFNVSSSTNETDRRHLDESLYHGTLAGRSRHHAATSNLAAARAAARLALERLPRDLTVFASVRQKKCTDLQTIEEHISSIASPHTNLFSSISLEAQPSTADRNSQPAPSFNSIKAFDGSYQAPGAAQRYLGGGGGGTVQQYTRHQYLVSSDAASYPLQSGGGGDTVGGRELVPQSLLHQNHEHKNFHHQNLHHQNLHHQNNHHQIHPGRMQELGPEPARRGGLVVSETVEYVIADYSSAEADGIILGKTEF